MTILLDQFYHNWISFLHLFAHQSVLSIATQRNLFVLLFFIRFGEMWWWWWANGDRIKDRICVCVFMYECGDDVRLQRWSHSNVIFVIKYHTSSHLNNFSPISCCCLCGCVCLILDVLTSLSLFFSLSKFFVLCFNAFDLIAVVQNFEFWFLVTTYRLSGYCYSVEIYA